MVKAYPVERVQQSKLSLDLVGLNHAFQDITDGQGLTLPCKVVCDGKNSTEVIGGVPPFRSEPAVIEIEPTNLRADVESASNGVNLVIRPRDLCACTTPSVIVHKGRPGSYH